MESVGIGSLEDMRTLSLTAGLFGASGAPNVRLFIESDCTTGNRTE